MTLQFKTRGSMITRHQPRVFLSCDYCDTALRDTVISHLLSHQYGIDAVVVYDDGAAPTDKSDLQDALHECRLLVLVVSSALIAAIEQGQALPVAVQLAKDMDLPVVPIAVTAQDLPAITAHLGAVHALAMTQPSFFDQLKAMLGQVVVTVRETQAILDKAFSATLFLSYRKKDVTLAREVVHRLHDLYGLESVAVWYDSYLTAGRAFDDEIRQSIDAADAFVLLVTDHLMEPGNYVMTDEYPYARDSGKIIFGVAPDGLPAGYRDVFDVDVNLSRYELDGVRQLVPALRGQDGTLTAEQSYYLGLAYLYGVMVERDPKRGVDLIEDAGDDDGRIGLDAMKQMVEVHTQGLAGSTDHYRALLWINDACDRSEQLDGRDSPAYAECLAKRADICVNQQLYDDALSSALKAQAIYNRLDGQHRPELLSIDVVLTTIYLARGDIDAALRTAEAAATVADRSTDPEDQYAVISAYGTLGSLLYEINQEERAEPYLHKAIDAATALEGPDAPILTALYNNLALLYNHAERFAEAQAMAEEALRICRESPLGMDLVPELNTLGLILSHSGQYQQAIETFTESLARADESYGPESGHAVTVLNNIGDVYYSCELYKTASKFFEYVYPLVERQFGMFDANTIAAFKNYCFALYSALPPGQDAGQLFQTLNMAREFHLAPFIVGANERPRILSIEDARAAERKEAPPEVPVVGVDDIPIATFRLTDTGEVVATGTGFADIPIVTYEMREAEEAKYVGQHADIAKGLKSYAKGTGTVVIDGDELTLYDGKQQVIAKAPLSSIQVKSSKLTMGAGYYVGVDGVVYSVSWIHCPDSGVGGLLDSARGFAEEFRAAYEARSGHTIQ